MLTDIVHKKIVVEIENNSSKRNKYIFGQNIYTDSLLANYKFHGIIDETSSEENNEFTINNLEDIPEGSIVIVASGGRTTSAVKKCKAYGHEVIDYFTFLRFAKENNVAIRFNDDALELFNSRKSEILDIYNLLEDNLSKDLFSKIIDFRVSSDSRYLIDFKENQAEQYFEDFLVNDEPAVFFDVGGYDGFTTRKFLDYYPSSTSVIFEPNQQNYKLCIDSLGADDRVTICNFGLHDTNELGQMSGGGSESDAIFDGSGDIEFKKLDDTDLPTPTVIKMDIEGGELAALKGSEKTIISSKCTLAIASYHSFSQLIDVPNYILNLGDYKVYFRHYTESIYESVFFFIPR